MHFGIWAGDADTEREKVSLDASEFEVFGWLFMERAPLGLLWWLALPYIGFVGR